MALISIVMPAYNSSKHIEQAIRSVQNQTYKNIELIICDDGSSDNTIDIVNKFIIDDKRIILIKNNLVKGAAGARNSCLNVAKGEYISFLDSDDYWAPEKLEVQYNYMKSNNILFSYSNYYMFSDDMLKEIKSRPVVHFNCLTYTCDIGCLTVMLSRKLLKSQRFPYIGKEDYAFWLLLLQNGASAYNCNSKLAYYRKQHNSLSSNKFSEIFKQYNVLKKTSRLSNVQIYVRLISYTFNAVIKHYFFIK